MKVKIPRVKVRTRELKIPEINCYLLSEPVSKDRKYYFNIRRQTNLLSFIYVKSTVHNITKENISRHFPDKSKILWNSYKY